MGGAGITHEIVTPPRRRSGVWSAIRHPAPLGALRNASTTAKPQTQSRHAGGPAGRSRSHSIFTQVFVFAYPNLLSISIMSSAQQLATCNNTQANKTQALAPNPRHKVRHCAANRKLELERTKSTRHRQPRETATPPCASNQRTLHAFQFSSAAATRVLTSAAADRAVSRRRWWAGRRRRGRRSGRARRRRAARARGSR